MKANFYSNFNTELDPHNPYLSAGRPVSPTRRSELTDRSWPFLGSLALHALLFAILFHSGFQYPILISSKTAAVHWLSMIDLQDISIGEGVSLNGPAVASASQQQVSEREYDRQQPADDDDPVRADVPAPPTASTAATAEPELTLATSQPVMNTARTGDSHIPQAITPRHITPAPTPPQIRKKTAPLAPEPESPRALPAKQPAMGKAVENRPTSDDNLLKNEVDNDSRQIIEQKQQAADKLRREQAVREQELRAARDQLEQKRAAAEKARQQLLASEKEPAVQPADKPMSVSLPQIKGDFKLVITGHKLPGTTITFKDFPLSRRDRPFSRAESHRSTKIVPLTANRENNTREFVIARTSPGVYTITVEQADEAANVTLSIKLYEGTPRAIARNLGKFAVARERVEFKVLMPDGIFWDDNSAFSGNLEDSDGVTKFISETGLMWKEYND